MKKSNWILVGIVVLLVLLGFLYLIPIREGAVEDKLLLNKNIKSVKVSKDKLDKNKNDPKRANTKK